MSISARRLASLFAIALAASSLASCRSIGPGTVSHDRFNYASAIADSWKQQMLLNIVNLRYADPPVFLEVASVIDQYVLEGLVSVGGQIPETPVTGGNVFTAGGTTRVGNRPTITYQPLYGHRFTRSLLTPIAPASVFSMVQSGWSIEAVLSLRNRRPCGERLGWGVRSTFATAPSSLLSASNWATTSAPPAARRGRRRRGELLAARAPARLRSGTGERQRARPVRALPDHGQRSGPRRPDRRGLGNRLRGAIAGRGRSVGPASGSALRATASARPPAPAGCSSSPIRAHRCKIVWFDRTGAFPECAATRLQPVLPP